MQDISEMASKMEMEEQKKRERTPKQTQETSMVTSDTALPEQKKMHNELLPSTQALVKALFQAATEATPTETPRAEIDMTSSPTTDKVVIEEETALQQDSMHVDHCSMEIIPVKGKEGNTASTQKSLESEESPQDNARITTQVPHNTSSPKHIKKN